MEPSRRWGDDRAILDDEETRRRILDAAGRCIVRCGNSHSRVGEVADEARVSRSTVYRKTIADGLSEAYHIQTLHPELLRCAEGIPAPQQLSVLHRQSDQPYGVRSPSLDGALGDEEVWSAYVCPQSALMGAAEGTPFPAGDRRPGQPVADLFANRTRRADRVLMTRMPPGAPRTKPTDVRLAADAAEPAVVLTQDTAMLPGLQRGMHQPSLTHMVLSREESRMIDMHRNLRAIPRRPALRRADAGVGDGWAAAGDGRGLVVGPEIHVVVGSPGTGARRYE